MDDKKDSMDRDALNKKFGKTGVLEFQTGKGGFPAAVITNRSAKAIVSLYGAHVLSYHPAGQDEVLWMSSDSMFENGKPIRGGIPVCFPWFGPHESDSQKPQHGFARLQVWEPAGVKELPGGETEFCLCLKENEESRKLWPYVFRAEMIITVGAALDVQLRCTNTGTEPFTYTDALHSYFLIHDIASVRVAGLRGARYFDGPKAPSPSIQNEEFLEIRKEENRRYIDTISDCSIIDHGLSRTICVKKTSSTVTVVWNPGEETTRHIPDMPDDGYKTMLCVEAVNAYNNKVQLQPQQSHTLSTNIRVE